MQNIQVFLYLQVLSLHLLALLALRTAPGLGYGLCWNKGPEAVESTPVLASPVLSSPADQPPLEYKHTINLCLYMFFASFRQAIYLIN